MRQLTASPAIALNLNDVFGIDIKNDLQNDIFYLFAKTWEYSPKISWLTRQAQKLSAMSEKFVNFFDRNKKLLLFTTALYSGVFSFINYDIKKEAALDAEIRAKEAPARNADYIKSMAQIDSMYNTKDTIKTVSYNSFLDEQVKEIPQPAKAVSLYNKNDISTPVLAPRKSMKTNNVIQADTSKTGLLDMKENNTMAPSDTGNVEQVSDWFVSGYEWKLQ